MESFLDLGVVPLWLGREKKMGLGDLMGRKGDAQGGGGGKHVGERGSGEFRGSMVGWKESGAGARYFPILDRRDRKLLFWEGCQGTLGSSLPRRVHICMYICVQFCTNEEKQYNRKYLKMAMIAY
ncbi:hypothetical protein VPH35_036428 [Triticum aestivum]